MIATLVTIIVAVIGPASVCRARIASAARQDLEGFRQSLHIRSDGPDEDEDEEENEDFPLRLIQAQKRCRLFIASAQDVGSS